MASGCDPVTSENVETTWAESSLETFGEFCFETDNLALKGTFNKINLISFFQVSILSF